MTPVMIEDECSKAVHHLHELTAAKRHLWTNESVAVTDSLEQVRGRPMRMQKSHLRGHDNFMTSRMIQARRWSVRLPRCGLCSRLGVA